MRQSRTEMKAIEAELRSIRADRPASVTLLHPPNSTDSAGSVPAHPTQSSPRSAPVGLAEALKVARSPQPIQSPSSSQTDAPRRVACFPLPNASTHADRATHSTRVSPSQGRQQQGQPPRQLHSTQAWRQSSLPGQWQSLEVQVQRINQLAALQETAILQFKALAAEVAAQQSTTTQSSITRRRRRSAAVCEYLDAAVPHVERNDNGVLVLTTRPVDLYRAEREAAETAQVLRQRTVSPRRFGVATLGRWLWQPVWSLLRVMSPVRSPGRLASRRHRPIAGERSLEHPFTLMQGLKLLAGAALVRVALDVVVAAYPALWLPSLGLMVTPAAIAIYRSTVAPAAGFAWGYRLFAIMIGLLLGGRL
ncbi:MAG: hypothetical protein IGS50_19310 [Synechococcales cyanobacterium C42_A2020_086]|nr:hypothetical protein [Synechococcales cyanobacterium C42_A2020_086]